MNSCITNKARLVALYLPQFHPIPENDLWWGKGFTEWTNVAKARPLFKEHYQPHIPADLGFYDLRLPETREAQAELARAHGIEGFCYWHYWFNGKRLIERPFNEILASGRPDFPFCLAWANESWSRRWLGEERDVLIEQTYSRDDDLRHALWLLDVFADPRNIRINGRPLFLVYRPKHLPEPERTVDTIRNECVTRGLPDPFLVGIDAHCRNFDCRQIGFDGTMKFEPQLGLLPNFATDEPMFSKLVANLGKGIASSRLKVYDYEDARKIMNSELPTHPYYPSIMVGWDNTPRRGANGIVVVNNSPEAFATGLTEIIKNAEQKPYEDRLIFLNAWNEWAEGNHLEPDLQNGSEFLRNVLRVNTANNL